MRLSHIAFATALALPGVTRAEALVFQDVGATATLECTKERSEVVVNGPDNTITVKGGCTQIVISGADNTLTIASVGKLLVQGADNTVAVDEVGSIVVTGADNRVTYRRGPKGKKPKIRNTGTGNVIAKAP